MSKAELELPLEAEALREIERSLFGKLKAHRLSDSFIERFGEDAVQKGFIEYLRAVESGTEVGNRDAFVVRAAFCRAIDELRREARQSDGAAVEAALASGHLAEPASEELAVERLAAEELHAAIDKLPAEERQALSLHYFEELSNQRSAEILYCSERTFRRCLGRALRNLSRRLGVPAPEPGSDLAIEVGLVAWVSLGGAKVVPAHGALAQVAAVVDSVQDAAAWTLGRTRELVARFFASGSGERMTEIASGPVGKAGGACTGALALCAFTGVIGPGVGGVDVLGGKDRAQRPAMVRQPPSSAKPAAPLIEPQASPMPAAPRSSSGTPTQRSAARRVPANQRKREARQVREQTDAFARAAGESETVAPSPAPTPVPKSETATEPTSPPPSTGSAGTGPSEETEQAEQQFGAFR